jgi:hypothetical protein
MTRIGTTQAHRNLLKTLQAGLKSTAARERLFAVIAERRVEWERLRASRPRFYGWNGNDGADEKESCHDV